MLDPEQQREADMTAELFRSQAKEEGLRCMSQEHVNWRGRRLIDCFTTLARADSKWPAAGEIVRNPGFMREAQLIRQGSQVYLTKPRVETLPRVQL